MTISSPLEPLYPPPPYTHFSNINTVEQCFSTGVPRQIVVPWAPPKCAANFCCPYFYYPIDENKEILFAICDIKLFF